MLSDGCRLVRQPTPYVLTPAFNPVSFAIASRNPWFASLSAYGSVALVSANVEVRGTAAGHVGHGVVQHAFDVVGWIRVLRWEWSREQT